MANLTQDDLDAIKGLIEVTLDEKLEEKFTEKLGSLPSKDEFYEQTTKLLKKMEDMEVSIDILDNRTSKHTDQIEDLQKIHPDNKHFALASV